MTKLHGEAEYRNYPLIEICGQIDSGKRFIAQMVARRIAAKVIYLPHLSQLSPITKAVLAGMSNPDSIVKNPAQWCHLYGAQIYEVKELIEHTLTQRPVIVTNYTNGFRGWIQGLGVKYRDSYGWCEGLPRPNKCFVILGEKWSSPTNIGPQLPSSTEGSINMTFHRLGGDHIRKIWIEKTTPSRRTDAINQAVIEISKDISSAYKIKENPLMLYTKEMKWSL